MISAEKASPVRGLACMALCFAPAIGGCAVHTEPVIQQSSGNVAGMREVTILTSDTDTGLRANFRERLKAAFRARGVVAKDPVTPAGSDLPRDEAGFVGDFALSLMPGDMSLASSATDQANSGSASEVTVRSAARRNHLLDGCEAVRYRASLVLFNRATGARVHNAEGESQGCAGDPAPVDDLANLLVRDALLAPN